MAIITQSKYGRKCITHIYIYIYNMSSSEGELGIILVLNTANRLHTPEQCIW